MPISYILSISAHCATGILVSKQCLSFMMHCSSIILRYGLPRQEIIIFKPSMPLKSTSMPFFAEKVIQYCISSFVFLWQQYPVSRQVPKCYNAGMVISHGVDSRK